MFASGARPGSGRFFGVPVVAVALTLAALSACAAGVSLAPGSRAQAAGFAAPSASASLAPLPSRGCRLSLEQRARTEPPGIIERHLSSGGHQRRFLLALPPESAAPMPLVLNLHGLMETPEMQQLFSRMEPLALERGWAIAWPEGLGYSWNAGSCCGRAKDEQVDDVLFLRELVAQLGRERCIDLRRVYATGMSNGGFMSFRLACEASDLFAAVAPVAAVEGLSSCAPRRPVPVLAFNGTSDLLVAYDGSPFTDFPSVPETLRRWRARNQCAAGEGHTLFDNGDAKCIAADGCAASGDLISCAIDGGGHTWPGGMLAPYLGKTSRDLEASRVILDFFAAHARP